MPWTPTKQVIDLTKLADNLLAYIEAQDAAALTWANGGTALPEFAATYSNATGRLQTIFPSVLILNQQVETDLTGDVLLGGWEVTLEVAISGADADTLATTTKKYGKAIESILSNIPSATLTSGSSPAITAALFELRTLYDQTRQLPSMAWVQIFQTRGLYQLIQAAY